MTDALNNALFDTAPYVDDSVQSGALSRRFGMPPFSVLDSRQGYWRERKNMWMGAGLASHVGREETVTFKPSLAKLKAFNTDTGHISVFDPVLCETLYRWFCPPGGHVLDPYAGGSVRGIVAGVGGYNYTGVDISATQVQANYEQADQFVDNGLLDVDSMPTWLVGDSTDLAAVPGVPTRRDWTNGFDLVLSCPPYGNLERYSDDPADISTMPWPQFLGCYREAIRQAVDLLRPNRFCAWVVGEYRDPQAYRNFVGTTVEAFSDAGAWYYNEAVLLNAVGTAAMRASAFFPRTRKLTKLHQNVLVFCKGDHQQAAQACDPQVLDNVEVAADG